MRHLFSLVLSLVLAPLIWLGVGIGGNRIAAGRTGGASPQHPDPLLVGFGLAALMIAGLLYALLVLSRLSPLGPVLVGLAYLGATGWAVLAYDSFRNAVPADLGGLKGVVDAPAGGVAALLAVPLVLTVFSGRRWRRRETAAQEPTTFAYSGPAAPAPRMYPPPPYRPPAAYIPPAPTSFALDDTRSLHPTPVDDDVTESLYHTPPPQAAYPPPGHASWTAAPTDPDATRHL